MISRFFLLPLCLDIGAPAVDSGSPCSSADTSLVSLVLGLPFVGVLFGGKSVVSVTSGVLEFAF